MYPGGNNSCYNSSQNRLEMICLLQRGMFNSCLPHHGSSMDRCFHRRQTVYSEWHQLEGLKWQWVISDPRVIWTAVSYHLTKRFLDTSNSPAEIEWRNVAVEVQFKKGAKLLSTMSLASSATTCDRDPRQHRGHCLQQINLQQMNLQGTVFSR